MCLIYFFKILYHALYHSLGKFLLNSPWDPPYLFLSLGFVLAFPPPWTVTTTARTSPFYVLPILWGSAQVPASPW